MKLEDLNTTLVCLSDDGRVFRLPLNPLEVAVDEDAIFSAIREGQKTKINDALLVGKLPTSLCVKTNKETTEIWATIPLPFVRFNSSFRATGEAMVPVFDRPSPDVPQFNVDWNVDVACNGKIKLWFMVGTQHIIGGRTHAIKTCYIVATSNTNRCYRIPLSNVYDDCKICMGEFDTTHPRLDAALEAALGQLLASPWNSDLRKPSEKSDAFFRFKLKNDGYKTLPCIGQWNNLCERVSVPVLDNLCLPKVEGETDEIF